MSWNVHPNTAINSRLITHKKGGTWSQASILQSPSGFSKKNSAPSTHQLHNLRTQLASVLGDKNSVLFILSARKTAPSGVKPSCCVGLWWKGGPNSRRITAKLMRCLKLTKQLMRRTCWNAKLGPKSVFFLVPWYWDIAIYLKSLPPITTRATPQNRPRSSSSHLVLWSPLGQGFPKWSIGMDSEDRVGLKSDGRDVFAVNESEIMMIKHWKLLVCSCKIEVQTFKEFKFDVPDTETWHVDRKAIKLLAGDRVFRPSCQRSPSVALNSIFRSTFWPPSNFT